MTLKQIKEMERSKREREKAKAAQGELSPEFKTAGLIIGLTPEARAEYFRRMREGAGV